jgi:hypothetical protein
VDIVCRHAVKAVRKLWIELCSRNCRCCYPVDLRFRHKRAVWKKFLASFYSRKSTPVVQNRFNLAVDNGIRKRRSYASSDQHLIRRDLCLSSLPAYFIPDLPKTSFNDAQ